METTDINSFDELVEFLQASDLTIQQTVKIIAEGLKVYFYIREYKTKEELIDALIVFWDKWGDQECKPIFGDLGSIDVVE